MYKLDEEKVSAALIDLVNELSVLKDFQILVQTNQELENVSVLIIPKNKQQDMRESVIKNGEEINRIYIEREYHHRHHHDHYEDCFDKMFDDDMFCWW